MPRRTTVTFAILLLAASAQAQSPRRGIPTPPGLLQTALVADVARFLEFSDEQVAGIREMEAEEAKQRRELFGGRVGGRGRPDPALLAKLRQGAQERLERFTKLVGPEKVERLRQIRRQSGGAMDAFFVREVGDMLGVTAEQNARASAALSDANRRYALAGAEERQRIAAEFHAALDRLLTDEQRRKWQPMLGEPVDQKVLDAVLAAGR